MAMRGIVGQTQTASRAAEPASPFMLHCGKTRRIAVLSRSFAQMNLLPTEPDMSKLYTEKFLPGAS
jgi:hypothetical protein